MTRPPPPPDPLPCYMLLVGIWTPSKGYYSTNTYALAGDRLDIKTSGVNPELVPSINIFEEISLFLNVQKCCALVKGAGGAIATPAI